MPPQDFTKALKTAEAVLELTARHYENQGNLPKPHQDSLDELRHALTVIRTLKSVSSVMDDVDAALVGARSVALQRP